MIRSALDNIHGDVGASELSKTLNKLRSKASPYAKIVNKLPAGKNAKVWDNYSIETALHFHHTKKDLASIRKEEKGALSNKQKALKSMEGPLLKYVCTLKKPQRIYFKEGEFACSYFLKKRVKKTTAKLTKKHLVNLLDRVTLDRNNPNLAAEIFDAIQIAQKDLVKSTDTVALHRGALKRL